MDDPNENARATSAIPELIIGTIGVGLVAAASIVPAGLAAALYILGGLTLGVAFLEAVETERACNANEPCSWAEKEREEPTAMTLLAIDVSQRSMQEPSRWRDAIREAEAVEATRSR